MVDYRKYSKKPGMFLFRTVLFLIILNLLISAGMTEARSPQNTRGPVFTTSISGTSPEFIIPFSTGPTSQEEFEDPLAEFFKKMKTLQKIWKFEFFSIAEKPVTVSDVVVAFFALIIGIILVKKFIGLFGDKVISRTKIKESVAVSIQKVLYYVGILMVVLFAMNMVNIPLTAFAFLGGALAIGVGFGAQTLINNFISGFIIMAEQPIKIGDLIEIEGNYATVEDIGARSTRIRTPDNIHILVPNSSFLENNIINWTLSDMNIRTNILVGVIYGSPVKEVKRLLLQAAEEHKRALKDPHPRVLFTDFGDNALIFRLFFWIAVEKITDRKIFESDIRFRIDELFREAGIVIAFPQRDVHLDSAKPLEVRILESVEGDEERRDMD